jgi:hypothetical protein
VNVGIGVVVHECAVGALVSALVMSGTSGRQGCMGMCG